MSDCLMYLAICVQVWLIEINVNPALHVNCEALKEVIPGVVEETLRECSPLFCHFGWLSSPHSEA